MLGFRVEHLNAGQKAVLEQLHVKVRVKDFADQSRIHSFNGLQTTDAPRPV